IMGAEQPRHINEIIASAELGKETSALFQKGMTPAAFLRVLDQESLFVDELKFVSQWLPRRECVWWGCQCFWQVNRPMPAAADDAVLRAVVAWVFDPNEEHRSLAKQTGMACGHQSAAHYLANAVFYCEGSISDPDLPEVLPPKDLAGKTVFASLMLLIAK